VGIHIRDEALTEGRVDWVKVQPLARLGYMDYTYVNHVFTMPGSKGQTFSPGMIGEPATSRHWDRVRQEREMAGRKPAGTGAG
ncbi:MAG: hypothetical protein AB7L41_15700, partial [Flavobacteriaceae bacterium]